MNSTNEQKEKQSKLITLNILVCIIIIIAIISISLYAWAKYVTSMKGNTKADVAKWSFNVKIDGETLTTGEINTFALTRDPEDTVNVKEGIIAPGTHGRFIVEVDTTGTEVLTQYDINISLVDCPTNLKFYLVDRDGNKIEGLDKERISSEERDGETFTTDMLSISRGIDIEKAGIYQDIIYWEWPFETGETSEEKQKNNIEDNKWLKKEAVTMEISATGMQVLETVNSLAELIRNQEAKIGDKV